MEMYTKAHFPRLSVFLSCYSPKLQMNTQILRVTTPPQAPNILQPVSGRLVASGSPSQWLNKGIQQ